jgi:dTDP-4-dehydrorhamnose 3,5-epimerase
MLYIPKGCAHGFLTLRENSIIAYKVDSMYTPNLEGTLHYADPTVGVVWPVPHDATTHTSDKDRNAKMLADIHSPFRF